MRDLDYLRLLSDTFTTKRSALAEVINLKAILALPKGNEFFFSDIHGEYQSFRNLVRGASGVVIAKIRDSFGDTMSYEEQLSFANLIYYPDRTLTKLKRRKALIPGTPLGDRWYRETIERLITFCRVADSKYTRSKVRKKLPDDYAYAIDELINSDDSIDKARYYKSFIDAIIEIQAADDFIITMCNLIHNLFIDKMHIIGDIFDRGPRADYVMDEIMGFTDVDIQWGNHDISWMSAAAGNEASIATVLRIATSYNSFDVLEDGYGINLRPLSMFAAEVYADDECECFKPHLLDDNKYDSVNPDLVAKMYKAIAIIEFKLEGQLIKRHPEYEQDDRLLLDKINVEKGTVMIGDKEYPMMDMNFPTIDWSDPYKLTDVEQELIDNLRYSFKHSERLQDHIKFLYSHGSMYKICNNNLLFHGCIPMNENGEFHSWKCADGEFSGKSLMDYLNSKVIDAYFLKDDHPRKADSLDLMWYLWNGPVSPVFGRDRMAIFERIFLEDKSLSKEGNNSYYEFSKKAEYCDKIFEEFGMNPERAHIINGHIPVQVSKGETPVKADGKLYIIDGGLSKAYHETTGIAGYTLIFNSHHLALAEHKPYVPGEENSPEIQVTEVMPERLRVCDTDSGRDIQKRISALCELIECFELGLLKER